jgi:hypothetical protein
VVQERCGRRATASLVTAVRASISVESPVTFGWVYVKWVRSWKREFAVALTLRRVEGRMSRIALAFTVNCSAPVREIKAVEHGLTLQ